MGQGESLRIAEALVPDVEIGLGALVLVAVEILVRWHFGRVKAPAILRAFGSWVLVATSLWSLTASFAQVWFDHRLTVAWPGYAGTFEGNISPAVWVAGFFVTSCLLCLQLESATGKRTRVMNDVRRIVYATLNPARR